MKWKLRSDRKFTTYEVPSLYEVYPHQMEDPRMIVDKLGDDFCFFYNTLDLVSLSNVLKN